MKKLIFSIALALSLVAVSTASTRSTRATQDIPEPSVEHQILVAWAQVSYEEAFVFLGAGDLEAYRYFLGRSDALYLAADLVP